MSSNTRYGRMILLSLGLLSLGACGGVLPSKQSTAPSPWQSFDQAMASYDQIVPGETRTQDLEQMGVDPLRTPNVRRLNYLELIEVFMPHVSVQRSDLDPALRVCLEVREACYAYEVQPGTTRHRRHGNTALDILGFRRETTVSGWQFSSLIVINDDTVVYKLWSGAPNIQREESERKPLGPLQNSGEKLIEQAVY
ncbi:MAG: hypothetical protein ACRES4_00255 [Nevskiales bacterium]